MARCLVVRNPASKDQWIKRRFDSGDWNPSSVRVVELRTVYVTPNLLPTIFKGKIKQLHLTGPSSSALQLTPCSPQTQNTMHYPTFPRNRAQIVTRPLPRKACIGNSPLVYQTICFSTLELHALSIIFYFVKCYISPCMEEYPMVALPLVQFLIDLDGL